MHNVKIQMSVIAPDKDHAMIVAKSFAELMRDNTDNWVKCINDIHVSNEILRLSPNQQELKKFRVTIDVDTKWRSQR